MLRLKNIRIESEYVEADFYPEDSQVAGHIVIDPSSEEIITCTEVSGYGASYTWHATQRLLTMAREKNTRTECLVMWY